MYDGTSPSKRLAPKGAELQRARGRARLTVKRAIGRSRVDEMYQDGCAKLRLPRVHAAAGDDPPLEALLLNTAGGLTGGDRFETEIQIGPQSRASVTTQACERVYRAIEGTAEVKTRLTIEEGAALHWLPQETILFDGGRIRRRLDVEMAEDAQLLAVEPLVLGRLASGEALGGGFFQDSWRIRRDGRLVFADETRLVGEIDRLAGRPALFDGAKAMAAVLYVGRDAEDGLDPVRRLLGDGPAGASAFDGLLACRLLAADSYDLRLRLIPLLTLLSGRPLPVAWTL